MPAASEPPSLPLASPGDWQQIFALLDSALELDATAHAAWLESLGAEHARLSPLLRDLLRARADVGTGRFMQTPPSFGISSPALAALSRVGPYRLLRELGLGGMASVWLAQRDDAPDDDLVALKLPHVDWHRAGCGERLERERAILSTLDHPGITRLLDAGVDEHRQPYLVLEHVKGEPIDEHCRRHGLDLRARLMLFAQAADAVAYAHRRQVLHRDLKPANVFVTEDGEVRLLDFGIAKLLDDGWSVETDLTRQSGRPLTPEYASPEQLRGEPAGIASDVYSLGVMLYELLCASRPHRREGRTPAAFEELVVAAIPRRPSEVAAEPTLRQALRGDLDAVVMKALRKPMHERYRSVEALVDDVQRFLDRRPVCAADESAAALEHGAAAPVRGLPARDVVLLGRQTDRAAVADLLRSRRLVCVVGHGGVGKTELACAVAAAVSEEFADGACWVDLAVLTSEVQLAPAIAAATGIALAAGDGNELVRAALAPRHLLLLLDNCEHLLAPVAGLVEALLASAPALRVLATSREPLQVSDEQMYRLDPLPAPPAMAGLAHAREYPAFQLLERRILRADLGFEFDDRFALAGAEVCQALDGVPLALEMAAAWVPKIGIEGVREMLHERLRMLRGVARGQQPLRQRSLRDLMDWSYGLLMPPEQLALRRLSAFAGPFDIELAERMIADESTDRWSAHELLAALLDKSLVSVKQADVACYRLLETTRLYAIERVQEAGESQVVQQRHGRLMAQVAEVLIEQFTTADDDELVVRFNRYYAEFESAFESACEANDAHTAALTLHALRQLDALRGVAAGMEARLVSATRLLADAAPLARATILTTIASCGWIQLPSISRAEAARQAVSLWREWPDRARTLLGALFHLGINTAIEKSADEARAALLEAHALADVIADARLRTTLLVCEAHVEEVLGDQHACLDKLREALPLAVAEGRRRFAGYVRVHLVEAAVAAGEYVLALELAPEMIKSMRDLGQREYLAIACHQVARAALRVNKLEAARIALAEALPLAWEFNRVEQFLEPLAHLAAQRGLVVAAARVCGFVRALGAAVPEEAIELCRAALEAPTLERALHEGALLTRDACRALATSLLAASEVRSIR